MNNRLTKQLISNMLKEYALIFLLVLNGCISRDIGPYPTFPITQPKVFDSLYVLTDKEAKCINPTNETHSNIGSIELKQCTWNCVDYDTHKAKMIILSFKREMGCWKLYSTHISNGICP